MSRNSIWVIEGRCDPCPTWDYLETEQTLKDAETTFRGYQNSDSLQYNRLRMRKFVAADKDKKGKRTRS